MSEAGEARRAAFQAEGKVASALVDLDDASRQWSSISDDDAYGQLCGARARTAERLKHDLEVCRARLAALGNAKDPAGDDVDCPHDRTAEMAGERWCEDCGVALDVRR